MSRILVVDDDASVRRSVRKLLERVGHVVRESADGAEALALLEADPPDILITDLNMPNLDGMVLLRTLRQQGKRTKTIVFSGSPAELLDVATALGAHATLNKPFTSQDLYAAVQKVQQIP